MLKKNGTYLLLGPVDLLGWSLAYSVLLAPLRAFESFVGLLAGLFLGANQDVIFEDQGTGGCKLCLLFNSF